MQVNMTKKVGRFTHEGGRAVALTPLQELRRSVLTCLLWEDTFYEDGVSIGDRIVKLSDKVTKEQLAALAIEARHDFNLRHVPLLLLLCLSKRGTSLVRSTTSKVINRPDELAELIALYWKDGKRNLPRQLARGIADAFDKFDEYQFAKWDRKDKPVRIRDVMFLTHPKPSKEKEVLYSKIANQELSIPNTWEVRLSSGEDKKQVWQDLLSTGKLPYLALLKNLRNISQAGVDRELVIKALEKPSNNVLPFRFMSAAKHAPSYEQHLEKPMLKCLAGMFKLGGHTTLLVDTSGSMYCGTSSSSSLLYSDIAKALAILVTGIANDFSVYCFSNNLYLIPNPRKGFALCEQIDDWPACGTYLQKSLTDLYSRQGNRDRLIIITDEQIHDKLKPSKFDKSYIINVAPYSKGIGYGNGWVNINGWSEACIKYIQEYESEFLN